MAPATTRQAILPPTDQNLMLVLPLLRAYGLAYISTTTPKLLNLVFYLYRKKTARPRILASVFAVLRSSIGFRTFPSFCGATVGGYSFLQWPLRMIYVYACRAFLGESRRVRSFLRARYAVSRFVAAFMSAWLSLQLLNGSRVSKAQNSSSGNCKDHETDSLTQTALKVNTSGIVEPADVRRTEQLKAGKTMDVTILAVARAIDTLVSNVWRHLSVTRKISAFNQSVYSAPIRYADSLVFAVSSGMVMWAWFYLPTRLPGAYNKWIGEAAEVDPRLIELLREARAGKFVYGQDTGFAPMVQEMCKEYGWPLTWGDPQTTIPIPCEIVHMGTGPSCHWHAAVRFARAFKFALATYIPLQLLVKARNPSIKAFRRACQEAVRSSAFLGAFVGLFYYGVCLARTCLGPKILDQKTVTPMMWDSGLCVKAGCALCGWSILIEAETRRPELSMFVAPRALATLLPRQYDAKYFWRERVAFSLSTAVLFTLAQEDPRRVRGVAGRLLHTVLK